MNVSVHGAKTQLSKLLDMVEDGEPVVIERHGRPVAELVITCRRPQCRVGSIEKLGSHSRRGYQPPISFLSRRP
ncbi:MAG TPA: type II toxin-antitoxin system prevent-host-death family antitoxin [Vicinamibacterales bacterium]|nr:type II toxin-antitoxin system prevent-host-death family antitoxin [Vicinamibacterales bacterium]